MKVLVAEDDPVSRRLLEVTLSKWGYEVVTCADGLLAWHFLQKSDAPSLVVLDWMIPGMDGLELVEQVRKLDTYIYVIMLTAKTHKQDMVTALAAGADDYITKPFDAQELRMRLRVGERILSKITNNLIYYDNKCIEFYSCFISHSSKDHDFASKIYTDLKRNNITCWYAPEDMGIGEKIRVAIDDSIKIYDKLLLILSMNSIYSQWVEAEVEMALEKERKYNELTLFPLTIDNHIMSSESSWTRYIRNTRNICDFTEWGDEEKYKKSFDRTLRDLQGNKKLG